MKITFVCTGNTCRSSMAEALAKKWLESNTPGFAGIEIASAGLSAWPGSPASFQAVEVMAMAGLDLTNHKSRQFSRETAGQSDIILTMTAGHKSAVLQQCPEAVGRVFTLSEFAGENSRDIADPFGQGVPVYEKCAREIRELVEMVLHKILQRQVDAAMSPIKIAIGCDHGGFRLKEEIKKMLQDKNYNFQDFGTFSEDAVDYPDIALEVARAVRDGEFDRGILICGTGIGIGIAANKLAGIRAALCHDTFSARASREHNNANILTMGERVIGPGLASDIVKVWLETDFAGGRHQRRVQKIGDIEQGEGGRNTL